MLVKFISFVITLFGTKRYKPVVFAGIAVIISAVGISAVVSVYKVPARTVASTAEPADDPTTAPISAQTPAKKDLHHDTTLQQQAAPATDTQPTTPSSGTSTTAATPAIQLLPADNTITVKQGDTLNGITLTLTDSSSAVWAISNDQANGLTIAPAPTDKTASFSLTAKAVNVGTYSLTVHAKDPARGGELATKNIIVTVTPN